jgi:hypothetical protein
VLVLFFLVVLSSDRSPVFTIVTAALLRVEELEVEVGDPIVTLEYASGAGAITVVELGVGVGVGAGVGVGLAVGVGVGVGVGAVGTAVTLE